MNGAFRYEPLPVFGERLGNAHAWWRRCQAVGAGGFLVTSWEPYRLAIEMATVVDAAIATLWLEPGAQDHVGWLRAGFTRVFGPAGAREAARVALAADETAFAGYARWERNERWDGTPTGEGLARAAAEARRYARLSQRPGLPPPLRASLGFRRYLAEREVFVRRAAKGVWKLRRLLATRGNDSGPGADFLRLLAQLQGDADAFRATVADGQRMARLMWRRTRSAAFRGPNEAILAADRVRLAHWRRWLAACRRRSDHARTASPVAGAWQLEVTVINFAPAVQRVVVEQEEPDGTWIERGGRHTIEFRTFAARPRTNLRRSLTVPLADPAARLRIVVRGVGAVALAQVVLTDGVTPRPAVSPRGRQRVVVGAPAPAAGWPVFDCPLHSILPLEFLAR